MQAIDLTTLELMDLESLTDPTRRLRVAFPISSATGTAASASVYFELEPGDHVGAHVDSAEEFLVILEGRGEGLVGEARVLVGLQPVNAGDPVVAGSHLFAKGAVRKTETDEGWITSACYSPHLGCGIGLGFLARGGERLGEVIVGANPLQGQEVALRVVS